MSRRWFAPEVVQTSAMDCGPASLKCLLDGLGIPVSYGRLREACQTDVDGTSIDTIEEIGKALGLDCEQVMVPVDHLLLPEANLFPAIAVVRLPNGFTHFVVAWRRLGPIVEIMDPSRGRRWVKGASFLEELYVHTTAVPAAAFREWAGSDEFTSALEARLDRLGCLESCRGHIATALGDPGWQSIATLDAVVRMIDHVVRAGGIARGEEAARMIASVLRRTRESKGTIPDEYFTARPAPNDDDGAPKVLLCGAVLVRCRRRAAAVDHPADPRGPLSPELAAALQEKGARVGRHLISLARADGLGAMTVLAMASAGAVIGTTLEAVLFRGLIGTGRELGLIGHRLTALGAVITLALLLLLLELSIAAGVTRLGRLLEARLRMAFLAKIPRLGDRYFQSRPTSDMAERSHAIHDVRLVPDFAAQVVRVAAELVVTTLAIAWIDPPSAPLAIMTAAVAIAVPFAAQPVIVELDLRARTHLGALSRFYFDALVGLLPVRTHGAERSVRREHEALLVEWSRAAWSLLRATVTTEAFQMTASYAMIAILLLGYLERTAEPGAALLLLYWALNLPSLGQELILLLRQYPGHRNRTLRLLEPLGAIEGSEEETEPRARDGEPVRNPATPAPAHGVSLDFEQVSVVAAGHRILADVTVRVGAGEHVALVGASGAGKSSLLGTLLGWHRAAAGRVLVDGQPLEHARIEALRTETAWVDPAIHLWNVSLLKNLRYGHAEPSHAFAPILEAACLHELLRTMPDGLQTALGEGGALVSGGEGQRVRFGRALLREDARLVLLDEPFRGLDRETRGTLLARARDWWRKATLLCVTHDIRETRGFDRVLVVDGGRIVEDGPPRALAADQRSRYAAMLAEEDLLWADTWSDQAWRRVRLERGKLSV